MSHIVSNVEIGGCQQEGYNAYLEGKEPIACPYTLGTSEGEAMGDAWFRGYAASKTDHARANRAADTASEGKMIRQDKVPKC